MPPGRFQSSLEGTLGGLIDAPEAKHQFCCPTARCAPSPHPRANRSCSHEGSFVWLGAARASSEERQRYSCTPISPFQTHAERLRVTLRQEAAPHLLLAKRWHGVHELTETCFQHHRRCSGNSRANRAAFSMLIGGNSEAQLDQLLATALGQCTINNLCRVQHSFPGLHPTPRGV